MPEITCKYDIHRSDAINTVYRVKALASDVLWRCAATAGKILQPGADQARVGGIRHAQQPGRQSWIGNRSRCWPAITGRSSGKNPGISQIQKQLVTGIPGTERTAANGQVHHIYTVGQGLLQALDNVYRCAAFFIFIRGIRVILTTDLVSDDIGAGGNTLHWGNDALQSDIEPITSSDTGHQAAMENRVLAHAAFIGKIINTDELVIAQYFRLAAQAQLLTEGVGVIVAVRGRILERNMIPVNAGVDDADNDTLSLGGRQAVLTVPNFGSADQNRACIGLDVMNFIGKQVFDARQAAYPLRLCFGQPERHPVEQIFVAGPNFRGSSSHLCCACKKLLQTLIQVFTISHSLRAEQIQALGGLSRSGGCERIGARHNRIFAVKLNDSGISQFDDPGSFTLAVQRLELDRFGHCHGARNHQHGCNDQAQNPFVMYFPHKAISFIHPCIGDLMVTSSSAAVGCMPIVQSKCCLVSPDLTAMANPWTISGASPPTI